MAIITGPFSMFVILYVSALMVDIAEKWDKRFVIVALLLFFTAMLVRINRVTLFATVTVSTVFILFTSFPDVANHVNLTLFSNVAIMVGILYSWLRPGAVTDDDDWYEWFAPVIRVLIILLFATAGFHKLNSDFINPAVSCGTLVAGWSVKTLSSPVPVLNVSIGTLGLAILMAALVLFWRERRHDFAWPRLDPVALRAPVVSMVMIGGGLLLLTGTGNITSPGTALLFGMLVFVLSWQLVEGPLLLHPRYQWVALLASLLVHVVLAMALVTDFQAIALALLATFVAPSAWQMIMRRQTITIAGITTTRAQLYFLINSWILMGLWVVVLLLKLPMARMFAFTGLVFNLSLLILLWPIFTELFSRNRDWTWQGVRPFNSRTPLILFAVPALMLAFSMTSYLGLRTAGNYSMFSNVRTEPDGWNHLILRGPIMTLSDQQQDVVHIHRLDFIPMHILHMSENPSGMKLPVIEFRKLLYKLRQAGLKVGADISYRGQRWTTGDIAGHPDWRVDRRDLAMLLNDFRPIQVNPSPNMCRW